MTLPSSVLVGGVKYEVQEVSRLRDKKDSLGRAQCHRQRIKIDSGLGGDAKAATLLHEVIHAILYQTGHDEHVEPHIRALGYGLLALMRDNEEWIRAVLDE